MEGTLLVQSSRLVEVHFPNCPVRREVVPKADFWREMDYQLVAVVGRGRVGQVEPIGQVCPL